MTRCVRWPIAAGTYKVMYNSEREICPNGAQCGNFFLQERTNKRKKWRCCIYLLTQPFSFGANCCCIATETYIHVSRFTDVLPHGLHSKWFWMDYSTLSSMHWILPICVFFSFVVRRNSRAEDERSAWHHWHVRSPVVRVDSCIAWLLRMLLHFICLFDS